MEKERSKRMIISLIILLLILIIFTIIVYLQNQTFTGKAILSSYAGTGYGNPSGIFSISEDNFPLTENYQKVIFTANVSQLNGYVYKKGYFWNYRLVSWVPFEFAASGNGNAVAGTSWISLSAGKEIGINATNNLQNAQNGTNYIIAYSCARENGPWGKWKCGCENANDNICNKWMLIKFNVTGAIWTVNINKSCVSDNDCSLTEECVNYNCVIRNNNQPNNIMTGAGTLASPYMITNCIQLQNITANLIANYALANDIDCSDTRNWNSGAGFVPIEASSGSSYLDIAFKGSLDGKRHKILNLYINSSKSYVGLFGRVAGIIKNIGLENSYVKGYSEANIGSIASSLGTGTIENCYAIGNVSSHESLFVGGLVGQAMTGGQGSYIKNCYAATTISGQHAGGITGICINCGSSKEISNSHWDINVSNLTVGWGPVTNVTGSSGRTTTEMKNQSTYVGWDFTNIWNIDPAGIINKGYPYLR